MTTRTADLFVRSAFGVPVALVEIRNRQNLSLDVAMELQQDLLDYFSGLRDGIVPYFLMLSQETGYLWDLRKQQRHNNPPISVFPTHDLMTRYWPRREPTDRLTERSFAILVFQWLVDLTDERLKATQEPEKSLAASGFLAAMHNAQVTREERV